MTGSYAARRAVGKMAKALNIRCVGHMRNLGHELSGAKMRRVQERKRMISFQMRHKKLQALLRGAPMRVKALWRTGLLPAAAHGSGASGVLPETLQRLRNTAGLLAGARQKASVTAWLATLKDEYYDPMYDVTVGLVCRYAATIWDDLFSLALLQRAWMEFSAITQGEGSWSKCMGPLSSVALSLRRIGWEMSSAHSRRR